MAPLSEPVAAVVGLQADGAAPTIRPPDRRLGRDPGQDYSEQPHRTPRFRRPEIHAQCRPAASVEGYAAGPLDRDGGRGSRTGRNGVRPIAGGPEDWLEHRDRTDLGRLQPRRDAALSAPEPVRQPFPVHVSASFSRRTTSILIPFSTTTASTSIRSSLRASPSRFPCAASAPSRHCFQPISGFYAKGGIYTVYSDDTGFTVDSFFNKPQYFTHLELGWSGTAANGTPIQARGPMDANNFSVTLWNKDAEQNGPPAAHGVAFNANYLIQDNVMVFGRGGWSEGWQLDRNLSAGVGWRPPGILGLVRHRRGLGAAREPDAEGPVHFRGVLPLPADDSARGYARRPVDPASRLKSEHRLPVGCQSPRADRVLKQNYMGCTHFPLLISKVRTVRRTVRLTSFTGSAMRTIFNDRFTSTPAVRMSATNVSSGSRAVQHCATRNVAPGTGAAAGPAPGSDCRLRTFTNLSTFACVKQKSRL